MRPLLIHPKGKRDCDLRSLSPSADPIDIFLCLSSESGWLIIGAFTFSAKLILFVAACIGAEIEVESVYIYIFTDRGDSINYVARVV